MNLKPERKSLIAFTTGILSLIALGFLLPKPELVLSILIRLMAAGIALYISIKLKEWKLLFLMAMYILMSVRQILTLLIWLGLVETNDTARMISELPGFFVTLLTLVSILYIYKNSIGKKQEHPHSFRTSAHLCELQENP